MASRLGRAESSGKTINDRDVTSPLTVAALLLTRLFATLLYHVSPRDPLAFGSALVVVATVSFPACFVPAWRATRTAPVRALKPGDLSWPE